MSVVAERTALEAAHDVVAALGEDAVAVYAIGSVAMDAFEPGASDLDLVGVLRERPTRDDLDDLIERVRALDFSPARGLELVLYAEGDIVLNLNTGPGMVERLDYGVPEAEWFWFVIDRAIAERHAIPLVGPLWAQSFEPVPRHQILAALDDSLELIGALNMARAWAWVESGEWLSKPAAGRWLRERVRAAIKDAS